MLWGALAAAAWMVVVATPVLAHGEADARALARNLAAGPYTISLWQVDGDSTTTMTPHLIVMFDGVMPATGVSVAVNSAPIEVHPSTTTANGWETTQGVAEGDQVSVTISDGGRIWQFDPVVVPPPPAPIPLMKEVILALILVTARVLWWAARRSARVWRQPAIRPSEYVATSLSEGVQQG